MARTKYYVMAGVAGVAGITALALFGIGGPRADFGGGSPSTIQGSVPKINVDPLSPVGDDEADRRATLNSKVAEATDTNAGESHVSKPVIAQEMKRDDSKLAEKPPEGAELPEVMPIDPDKLASKQPEPKAQPQTAQTDPAEQARLQAEREARQQQQQRRTDLAQRVQAQVDQLLANNGQPNLNIQAYAAPKKEAEQTAQSGSGGSVGVTQVAARSASAGAQAARQGKVILAAKPGDIFYAVLKVGFNSDDPRGLPVFATIMDQRSDGSYGPLHGAVLGGNVTFSTDQAAVTFSRMTLRDGRTAPVEAMAATLDDVRSGVAEKVNRHTFQRYSGLLAASLIQGAGNVGAQLVEDDQTVIYGENYVTVAGNDDINWGKAGLAALQPLGDNLSAALAKSFNRSPTKASPAGTDVSVVFLDQITIAEQ